MTYWGAVGVILLTFVLATGQSDTLEFGIQNPYYSAFSMVAFPPVICLLIGGLATESTWLSRFLGSAPLVLLGKASYCFYLIHMGYLQGYYHKLLPKSWKADRYWGEFLLLVLTAILLFFLVEKPLNRWLRAKRV